VDLLLQYGADPRRTNGDGESAVELAERNGNENVVLLLNEWENRVTNKNGNGKKHKLIQK
jgi:ankyrin repeat protein